MDENERRDSSTGLIIGMIIGGVLAIVAAGFWLLARDVERPPMIDGEPFEKVLDPDEAAKVGS